MTFLRMNRRGVLGLAIAASLPLRRAVAEERHYRLRLIAGEPRGEVLRAGIDITLDHGWKTYWRMPGDAGVPPQFDWSGSVNVKSVEVLWPVPSRFNDEGGETVGYKDRVVFPVHVTPDKRNSAVTLKLMMFFGVCKEICLPVDERARLSDWRVDPEAEALLASFEQRVPLPAGISSKLYIANASLRRDGDRFDLAVTFNEAPPVDIDIFVEGEGTAYFRGPRPGGGNTVLLNIEGVSDPDRLEGAGLKLTLGGRNIRLEQDVIVN